eukprot:TRINITY_DN6111_c0_g1_i3.p1 TRINITY_DN6111_c0_g1~~TRINITY_DN6111_c0_g1_i3.p1  ORF type:complete len:581 (-),score=108.72 TRINITY_DN6111_c0_g1_i3:181-1923(-)
MTWHCKAERLESGFQPTTLSCLTEKKTSPSQSGAGKLHIHEVILEDAPVLLEDVPVTPAVQPSPSHSMIPRRRLIKKLPRSRSGGVAASDCSGMERLTSWDTIESGTKSHISGVPTSPAKSPSRPCTPMIQRSRSSFEAFRTADEDKEELRAVFVQAEYIEEEQQQPPPHLCLRFASLPKQQREMTLDSVIGTIIVLNAIFIGFSIDAGPEMEGTILMIDIAFSAAFIMEVFFKLYVNGFREQFFGENRAMNLFDAAVISTDVVQVALQIIYPGVTSDFTISHYSSLFRVVRLARLSRILRLLRHPVLQTLLMMMHGMIGGLPTLGWALLLFLFSVYIVALVSRESLGREAHPNVYEHFKDVPRAMVTTFRCSFGECDSLDGTPIFEHVDSHYGIGFSIAYCLFAFSMSIGMFNVISAIFIQSTLAAARAMKDRQKKARLQDESLWASRVNAIVRKLLGIATGDELPGKLSESIDKIYEMDVSCADLDDMGSDPFVKALLDELDIDPEDHDCLSDILDVEQQGRVAVIELLQGIKRLRGNPRRSDIVTVDLMCRSMQNTLKDIHQLLRTEKSAERLTKQL